MTNRCGADSFVIGASSLIRHSSFGIRHSQIKEARMNRRHFIQSSSGVVAGLVMSGVVAQSRRAAAKNLANDRITVMVGGVGGRGGSLLTTFAGMDEVDLKYVCDIDERILGARTEDLIKNNERVAKK